MKNIRIHCFRILMTTNQNSLNAKKFIIAPPTWHGDFFSATHRCNCDQRKRPRTVSPWLSIFTSFSFQKITLDISQFWHFFFVKSLYIACVCTNIWAITGTFWQKMTRKASPWLSTFLVFLLNFHEIVYVIFSKNCLEPSMFCHLAVLI